jgi:hypothetical protein
LSRATASARTGHAYATPDRKVTAVAKPQRTGRLRPRHPAYAGYAKAE